MIDEIIPRGVQNFIAENIDSIAELEALLLLRANADAKFNAQEIADRLYVSRTEIGALLNKFVAREFLISLDDGIHYQFKPASTVIEKKISQLAETHARYLVPLTNFIHSTNKNKIQKFADAFRIRKDKSDG